MDQAERHREEHPRRDVAVVGMRDIAGNVFLVRTHKLTEWWQPVGGGIDPDETPVLAACRELGEEVGLKVDPLDLTLAMQTGYDFGEGTVYFFEMQVESAQPSMAVNEEEIIDSRWFSPQEAQHIEAFPATQTYLRSLVQLAAQQTLTIEPQD